MVELKKKHPTNPCHKLRYCLYGSLVENSSLKEEPGEQSYTVFGHNCIIFEHAENIFESKEG